MAKSQTARGKTPWLVLLLMLLVGAAISAGSMYFFFKQTGVASESDESVKVVDVRDPTFVTVAPFTVNLRSEGREQRLLYIGLSVQVQDESTKKFLLQYMPQVRSRLLTLMASKTAHELMSPEGKAQLSSDILDQLQLPMAQSQPELNINSVLYTDFIVQ